MIKWVRYQTWRSRRRSRHLSRYSQLPVTALVNGVSVGKFRRGKEVER